MAPCRKASTLAIGILPTRNMTNRHLVCTERIIIPYENFLYRWFVGSKAVSQYIKLLAVCIWCSRIGPRVHKGTEYDLLWHALLREL